jgi:hypothetical protein
VRFKVFLRRSLKFACRFVSTVITVASSEGNLKEAAVIETSRIAKVGSVSASLWIAPAGEGVRTGPDNQAGLAPQLESSRSLATPR